MKTPDDNSYRAEVRTLLRLTSRTVKLAKAVFFVKIRFIRGAGVRGRTLVRISAE